MTDIVERLHAYRLFEDGITIPVNSEDIDDAITEIETLRAVLRMVKADRPTAHSDAVWSAIIGALGDLS